MYFKYQQWDERFSKGSGKNPFDTLWDLFQELLTISSGDVDQALHWLTELDNEYGMTDQFEDGYGLGDFVEELEERGYIRRDDETQTVVITRKTERSLRQRSWKRSSRTCKRVVWAVTKRITPVKDANDNPKHVPGSRATISATSTVWVL
ncbi:MAG: hypothetical protein U5K69_02450 [Balneolaceae bacterium]|nr:hypothetical protein [Balneolaceae bacterium]